MDFHCRVKFYVLFTCVKNTHVNSFHCCVKSFCCAAFFAYVYVRFRPTNALEFDLSGKKKMAAAVNKRLLPLFYLRQRRKRKLERYRKKYWIRDIFRSRFLLGEYHTPVKEMHENDISSLLLLTKPLNQNTSPCSMNLLTRWTIELNMALM